MTSFFHQVRTLTLGAAHDLLDKAIDLNSPTMLRQYVRDLETAIGEMQSEAAIQDGQLRTLKRQKADLGSSLSTGKETIAKLLESTDPKAATLARYNAGIVLQDQTRLAQMDTDIANQQAVSDRISLAVRNLQSKHDLMVGRVHELERLDRDSKSKEHAAAALSAAASLAGGPTSASIDNLEEKMRARNDVASAKFDQSMGTFQEDSGVDSSDVDALLASLSPATAAK